MGAEDNTRQYPSPGRGRQQIKSGKRVRKDENRKRRKKVVTLGYQIDIFTD